MNKKDCCKKYKGGKIPPCAQYLNNNWLLIKDGKLIYRNLNRLFFFVRVQSKPSSLDSLEANIQISLQHYIIGIFLHELLQDFNKYNKECTIASDPKTNSYIHKLLQNPPDKLNDQYNFSLTLSYSNQDAILNPFTYSFPIKPLLFYILLIINRIENHPGLFFANNNLVTEDTINFVLASMNLELPMSELYNDKNS